MGARTLVLSERSQAGECALCSSSTLASLVFPRMESWGGERGTDPKGGEAAQIGGRTV